MQSRPAVLGVRTGASSLKDPAQPPTAANTVKDLSAGDTGHGVTVQSSEAQLCHSHPSSLMPDHISAPHPDTQAFWDPRASSRCEGLEPQDRTGPQLDVTHPPRIQRCWRCGMTHAPQEKHRATSSHRGSCWLLASRTLPVWPVHHHAGPLAPCMPHSALSCPASGPGHWRAQHPAVVPQSSSLKPPRAPPVAPSLSHPHAADCPSCTPVALPATGRQSEGTLLPAAESPHLGSSPRDRTGRGRWDTSEWTRPVHQVPVIPSPTLGSPGPVLRASTF